MQRLGDAENNISHRLSIFNRCKLLIRTMPTLVHNPKNPEDVLKVDADEDGQGGDDAYDSLRYGLVEMSEDAAKVGASPIAGYRG